MNINATSNKGLVLVADEMHLSLMPMLEELGYKVHYKPTISRNEIMAELGNYVGLIIRSKTFVDAELLQNAHQLKFIGRAGAGLDLIDIPFVASKNIEIFAANEGNRVAVAEHVLGMLLNLLNNISVADAQVRNGIWLREENRGVELMGKTVAIIGYGNNGSETAKRLTAFGCRVLAHDIDNEKAINNENYEAMVSMQTIFNEAEIVSLHLPLTAQSAKMVNAEFFNQFKKKIFFINAARGEIVVLKDLVAVLESGKVRGACLDVLENEKLAKLSADEKETFDKLVQMKNVILTPHIAGWTFESYEKINKVLIEKIAMLNA